MGVFLAPWFLFFSHTPPAWIDLVLGVLDGCLPSPLLLAALRGWVRVGEARPLFPNRGVTLLSLVLFLLLSGWRGPTKTASFSSGFFLFFFSTLFSFCRLPFVRLGFWVGGRQGMRAAAGCLLSSSLGGRDSPGLHMGWAGSAFAGLSSRSLSVDEAKCQWLGGEWLLLSSSRVWEGLLLPGLVRSRYQQLRSFCMLFEFCLSRIHVMNVSKPSCCH